MAGSPKKPKPNSYTVADFQKEFPTDDSCLEWLWRELHSPDGHTPLMGEVEIDEPAWGGKIRGADRSRATTSAKRRQEAMAKVANRPTIFAMVERGGRVRVAVIPSRNKETIHGLIRKNVSPDA